jgi:hypothetical protein
MFCGIGIELALFPSAVAFSAFRYLLELSSAALLASLYFVVGFVRLISLVLNGRLTYGSEIRAMCSVVSALVWLQMAAALLRFHMETGSPPAPGMPVFAILFLAEVYSTYRAVSDGRSSI